jgi:TonB family protein
MALPQGLLVAVDVLGVVLLHFLWQGVLIGSAYAVLKALCVSARARYRLGLLAMSAMAVAPLLTAFWVWPARGASAVEGATIFADTLQAGGKAIASWQLQPLLPWLVALWLFGVVVLAARALWQWRALMRMVQFADVAPPEWQARLRRLCERFQLRRPVRLLYSTAAATPMLLGWIKPVILLPASMLSGFSPVQIEMIIAHELGHIRRFDYLVNLVQVAIETVLFYHPVVHWISRDVRNAREACCDDLALQFAGGSRLVYARALAELEELRLAPALGAGGGALLARIKRIVGEEAADPLPRSYALPIILVCAAMASLAWRPQHNPELDAALKAIPVRAMALLNTVTFKVQAPGLALDIPPPRVQAVRASTQLQVTATEAASSEHRAVALPIVDHIATQATLAAPQVTTAPAPIHVETSVAVPAEPATSLEATKAAPLHVVPPAYPANAMIAGIEGSVTLQYQVEMDGSVSRIRVVSARPAGIFDEAAKNALRGWLYPASSAGEQRTQNFAFTLHGKNRTEEQCATPTGSLICRHP